VAGYSGTPLQQKLGLKEGWRVAFVDAPPGFAGQFEGLQVRTQMRAPLDAAVAFVTTRRELERRFDSARRVLADDGVFWVAWPKKASRVPTDLTEDVLREVGLPTGMVDVKVCAVDDTWSGLKFVLRISERAGRPRTRP
jgi:hypothetical protein